MQVEILDWRAAAAMIEAHFHATHGAEVTLPALPLGSGLVLDHSQNRTVAANAIAER